MKTVVILGAGCSAGLAGLPTDCEFLRSALSPHINPPDGYSVSTIQDVVDDDLYFVIEAYKCFYQRDAQNFGGNLLDVRLETFWNEIDENYNKSKIVLHSNIVDLFFRKAKQLAEKESKPGGCRYQYFSQYMYYDTTSRSPYEYFFMFAGWQLRKKVAEVYGIKATDEIKQRYKKLIEKIKAESNGEIPIIISFNYDTLLEQALQDDYHYSGLTDMHLKENTYNIIKPHGSVNWLHTVGESIVAERDPITMDRIGYYAANKLQQHSIVGLVSNKIEFDEKKQSDPIVASLYSRRLLPILTRSIHEAEKLIVIGYSFPLTDGHVRRAIQLSKPDKLKELITVTKGKKDEETLFLDMFRDLGVRQLTGVHSYSVEDYIRVSPINKHDTRRIGQDPENTYD